jgi:hypothetical protein
MSIGPGDGPDNAIMQKRGFCLGRTICSIRPGDFRALRHQRQHGIEGPTSESGSDVPLRAPSMRRLTSTRNLTPKVSAMAWGSSMIDFDNAARSDRNR